MRYKAGERGPREFKSRPPQREGTIMTICKREVVTIPPTTRIKDASELMLKHRVRRLPVVQPGTGRLRGILITRDIINFLGGGEKYRIVEEKFRGNFAAAVNQPVSLIMSEEPIYATNQMSIDDVARLLLRTGVGGVPILDEEERVVGIVSERDFMRYLPSTTGTPVSYYMTRHLFTLRPKDSILDACREMISRGVRRLPVVEGRKPVGIVTSVDLLRYFGTSRIFQEMPSGRVEEALKRPVENIMTREVVTITPEKDLGEAASLMVEKGFGGLPVVEEQTLEGIITEHDLLKLLV
ncbi:MAG: CBS domain-containing protein [Candidatus Hadarchaeales archaeon]